MKHQTQLQKILLSHFEASKAKNPRYSIRSFAKKVGVTPGTLSLIMLGKRTVSRKLTDKIADNLLLDPQERSEVLKKFIEKKNADLLSEEYIKLSADQFSVVGEWHHFAILNLIKTKNFKSDVGWISSRIGLSKNKVSEAIDRLLRLELLSYDENKNLKRSKSKYRTPDNISNLSLKKSHHESLNLAHEALDKHSIDDRDFTWVTFAFDPNKMTEAKALIRKFQDDFLAIVQQESEMTEVYRMAIQMIPLTQLTKDKQ